MAEYVTREGTVVDDDVKTALTGLGSEATPGAITAPSNRIAAIIAAVAGDGTGVGAATWFLRIGGNAVVGGEQTICIGALGGTLATSDVAIMPAIIIPVDIPVVKGKQVSIAAEMGGSDIGSSEVCVTLVFE